MDRAGTWEIVDRAPVRLGGGEPIELSLQAAGHRKRREPGFDEGDRRAVPEAAVLRSAAHDRLAAGDGLWCQSQAGGAVDASDGASGKATPAPLVLNLIKSVLGIGPIPIQLCDGE